MPWGTKNMPPKRNLGRGSLSNWCDDDDDADEDAEISQTICRPPTLWGVDIIRDLVLVTFKYLIKLNNISNLIASVLFDVLIPRAMDYLSFNLRMFWFRQLFFSIWL